MPRMKSRMEHPPGGWTFVEPGVPQWVPPAGGFDAVARAILALRRGNPALMQQHNRSLEMSVIENELDEFNAARCLAHGWSSFVEASDVGPPNPVFLPPQRLSRVAAAATSLKRGATVGVAMIRDMWLGDSLKPVPPELSEKRAQTCTVCPRNDGDKDFIDKLTTEAANGIRLLLQARYDMELKTSVDDKLGLCRACGCVLKLKLHTPLDVAKKKLKPEEFAQLHETCWIRHES